MRVNIGVADNLRIFRHVDPSLGLIYMHPARAGSCVRPVAAEGNFHD